MKIAICDDDIKVQKRIEKYLKQFFNESTINENILIDTFNGSFDMLDYIESNKFQYDIVFMDIMLGKDNGIKLSKKILKTNQKMQIIFITAYVEYVEDIFDIVPAGLLIKPITYEKVKKTIAKLIKQINDDNRYITIKNKDGIYAINLREILYIESQLRYLIIHRQNDDSIKIIMNMAEMESMLNADFIKCHRSFLVNCKKIKKLEKKYISMINDKEIPVSASNYENVRAKYLYVLGEI